MTHAPGDQARRRVRTELTKTICDGWTVCRSRSNSGRQNRSAPRPNSPIAAGPGACRCLPAARATRHGASGTASDDQLELCASERSTAAAICADGRLHGKVPRSRRQEPSADESNTLQALIHRSPLSAATVKRFDAGTLAGMHGRLEQTGEAKRPCGTLMPSGSSSSRQDELAPSSWPTERSPATSCPDQTSSSSAWNRRPSTPMTEILPQAGRAPFV